jgi:nicotinate phosphoribosyltransferase
MSGGLFLKDDPSLALLTDQYELTMAMAYWKSGLADAEGAFQMFFRRQPFGGGFTVIAGLEPLLEYLESFRFSAGDLAYLASLKDNSGGPLFEEPFLRYLERMEFACDVDAVEEGTVMFPNEALLRIQGPIIQAQLLESVVLNLINFQSLIATKAARCCLAAKGDSVVEFGLRRAQGVNGALAASRAAYIGGCAATSNTLAGKIFGIPVVGTHAHSWVMVFDSEREAFEKFADAFPNNCVFLVDTYNTLEGVRQAVEVGKRLQAQGRRFVGIRLDSGDLAYFSVEARRMLDAAGLGSAVVMASNELDEYLIRSLKDQGAAIGAWGIGTKLVTAENDPALGGVYKLTSVRRPGGAWQRKLKLSEQINKISVPGVHQVHRYIDGNGLFMADAICELNEEPQRVERIFDPNDAHRTKRLQGYAATEPLLVPIVRNGKPVYRPPTVPKIRERVRKQLDRLHPGHKRFENPHVYPVGLSPRLQGIREAMIEGLRPRLNSGK